MADKAKKMIKASFWLLAISWYSRILSMVTVVFLARNLDKYAFGILAGCFVVKGFFTALSNLGSGNYLIRKKEITEHDINAAWSINVTSRLLMAAAIYLLSDQAAEFMKIPEISLVLKVMAISAVIRSMQNPAMTLKIKKLDYSQISMLEAVAKSVSSTISILIVVIYQTYWAVVIAEVVFNVIYAAGSQFIVRHRVRFEFRNIGEQWEFSKWILLKGIIAYVKASFDKIIVSRGFSVGELGLYNFSMESASTMFQFLVMPIKKVIYPGLSEHAEDGEMLVDKLYKSLLVVVSLYLPIVFGGVYLAELIVPTVFGSKWLEAVPLFNLFLVMTFAGMNIAILTDIFTLTGKVKQQFYYESVTSALFLLIMTSVSSWSLDDFTASRVAISYLMLVLIVKTIGRYIPLSLTHMMMLFMPPAIASGAMLALLYSFSSYFLTFGDIARLLISIVLGALVYGVLYLSMILVIRKRVPEYDFMHKTFILPTMKAFSRKLLRG